MKKWGEEGCVTNCALLCVEERTSSELLTSTVLRFELLLYLHWVPTF